MKKWAHDELLLDLAKHLSSPDRMIWMDMQMGPSGSPRPDVYSIRKSYTDPRPITYEIKISVSDFRSDITKGKWQSYSPFSSGIYFCVPQGLITKSDLPVGCGLMVRGDEGWRTIKAPTLQKVKFSEPVLLKMLIDGVQRVNIHQREQTINTYLINQKIRAKLGDDVADAITNRDQMLARAQSELTRAEGESIRLKELAKVHYEQEKARVAELNKTIDEAYQQLKDLLGVRSYASNWEIMRAAREFKELNLADTRLRDAEEAFSKAIKHLSEGVKHVAPDKKEIVALHDHQR